MDYIAHYGILGQKWGVRRYQNPDGTLTEAGKKRYIRQQTAVVGGTAGALGGYGGAIAGAVASGLVNPALTPVGAAVGGTVGATVAGYKAGKWQHDVSKEAVKGKVRFDEVSAKSSEIAEKKAYAKQDFKRARAALEKSDYFSNYDPEVADAIKKELHKAKTIEEFERNSMMKYGDHVSGVLYDMIDNYKYQRSGRAFIQNHQQQQLNQIAIQQHQDFMNQIAIQQHQDFMNQAHLHMQQHQLMFM